MSVCESLLSMVLQSVENVLKKAETLKDQLMNIENIACDKDGMVCQQKLQRIYHDALIRDLEYSLDHKAEVDLWNHGFRNSIVTLQSLARDKKNPRRDESENKLTRFLESATAFYSALLHDVCSAFDLELPFRRNGRSYACPKKILPPKSVAKPNKNSCYYMCQYCLVHLGDLARYRHLGRQAELFYRYAVQLSPCSGHPYNQLALVEAARGDRLSTVFYYVRSVSVRHPFPAAALNLTKTLNQYVDEEIDVEGRAKLTVPECVTVFLRFHGLLSKLTDLEVAEKYVKLLTNTLTALVATESFSATQLVQMLAINLYALHQRKDCAFLNKSTVLSDSGLEASELQAKRLVLHLVAGSLSAFLLPVYTLKDGEALLDYFALPAIKLTLDWIHLESEVLQEEAFATRRQIWPSLCKLLNVIQPYLADFSADKWTFVPLPEDKNLQCFIPLERLLNNYRFVFDEPKMEAETTNKLRASRLIEFGIWLSEQENHKLLKTRKDSGENDKLVFELAYMMPADMAHKEIVTVQETKDDILDTSTLTEIGSLDSDSTSGIGEGTGTQTPPDFFPISLPPPVMRDEELPKNKGSTLVKETSSITTHSSVQTPSHGPGIMKKYRQNVAMQAILKKMDQESVKTAEAKQVTFKTPTPVGSDSEKKTQNKQIKGSQEKQIAHQPPSKTISIAVHTSNDKNKSANASDSVGKNVTFTLHGSQENTQIQKEKLNVPDKVHSTAINFQDKNAAPLIKMGQDTVAGSAFLGSTSFGSPTPQEKSFTVPAQNSQKKSVTFTDEKILSFAAQVFQNRGLAYKGAFSSPVQQDKTSPLSSPAVQEKASPYATQGTDNKTSSTYPVANIKEKPITYSAVVQQETAKQPIAETSTWIYNKNAMQPPPPRDVRGPVALTSQTRTELPGTQVFGGVGSFSQDILKTPLFKLPDIQELRNTSDSNVSSPQLYSSGNALGTEMQKIPQSQYSMEINKSVYTGPDVNTKPDFTNVSSVDSSQLHIPAAIGSEHSAFQSPSVNFAHPHSGSRNFPDQLGKVRPPPGYTLAHVPQTPINWWKEDVTPASPLTTWWKMDTASGNRSVSHPPGDDSTGIQYSPLGYGRPPSQQLPLNLGNEGSGKTDTGYGSHLWSMSSPSSSVEVNLHHKLVGGTGQQQASYTTSGHQQPTYSASGQQQTTYTRPDNSLTGMFTSDVNMPMFGPRDTTERGLSEVTACNIGSYAPGGSLFPMPTRHSGPGGDNTYSLFSSTQWATPSTTQSSQQGMSFGGLMSASGSSGLGTQSLWSGPGPSPLERLLEQQKRLREGPASKKGT
ncbi:uncharacterized protein LOC126299523 [Schistocerca gregaria]|uniref:uncharacterized protein LOC126299523 n=1 Tax=Schistocerca gregaria TaxID=7010 RepID=UPI00211DD197|nr:uncharacterized protein LOC126299523 [Schistocerca gregaria]XP_049847450.1 uncharacterized protein LOC126299523 [Schistocerca gregaria]XP_049847451.1 uncharacterized protein LOC126299523 [Schistocerca gregaria]XP_049847452.1 uncharacterized protein LOC126299523 [Schistocerca gregaria]XP_049847453.1 uncharacterized protein LOC126299523 [Schistocerca gregaria]XP_049847454.1 uncharacterized protein LOC126299523 [Schistocerca gregaria]XP_049847455.1 uncharacterized protein LOC126299523 [Schist